jgi:hypothetical protein
VRLSSSRKHLSRAVEVPLNGPSYSAACAGSREQAIQTYICSERCRAPVYVTCRKVCRPDHQRPVGACVSPIKQTPWYVFLIYLSERSPLSRIIGGGSSVPSSLLVRNAHHVPAYDRILSFPTRQSRVGHERTCVPLVLEKEFSGSSGETTSGEGATPSPSPNSLPHLAVTCPLIPC